MVDPTVAPADDAPHPVGPESNFSESVYFQFGDPRTGVCGFLRMANRPNERSGERTVCVFLPGGRVALSFERPAFEDPARFEAAGMTVEVVEPLAHQRVSFRGEVHVLHDGWAMTDPRSAFGTSSRVSCAIDFEVTGIAPAQPFSLAEAGNFSAHHFDQLAAVRGTMRVGDERFAIDGHGLRDRSWGPRSWQAPRFYRFMFGASGRFGLAAAIMGREGAVGTGGFVWDRGRVHPLDEVVARQRYCGLAVTSVELELRSADRRWTVLGTAVGAVPLRNRLPDGDQITRILETSMRWEIDGHSLLGIAEYLDQVVDGRPVGIDEYDLAGVAPPFGETRANHEKD